MPSAHVYITVSHHWRVHPRLRGRRRRGGARRARPPSPLPSQSFVDGFPLPLPLALSLSLALWQQAVAGGTLPAPPRPPRILQGRVHCRAHAWLLTVAGIQIIFAVRLMRLLLVGVDEAMKGRGARPLLGGGGAAQGYSTAAMGDVPVADRQRAACVRLFEWGCAVQHGAHCRTAAPCRACRAVLAWPSVRLGWATCVGRPPRDEHSGVWHRLAAPAGGR
jgi:hypothetical protein